MDFLLGLRLDIRRVSRILSFFLMAAAIFSAGGMACQRGGDDAAASGDSGTLSVVTSIHPMEYFAQRIGGDAVEVTNLVAPGVEAHGYEPSPSDLRRIEGADLLVMNGLELEPWLRRALETLGNRAPHRIIEAADERSVRVIDWHGHDHDHDDDYGHGRDYEHEAQQALEEIDHLVHEVEDGHLAAQEAMERIDRLIHDLPSAARNDTIRDIDRIIHEWEAGHMSAFDAIEAIDEIMHGHGHEHGRGHDHDHDHGEYDPHVWLDPVIAITQVERIRDALIELAPDHADLFQANAQALIDELENLHSRFQTTLSSCVHDHFVTTHAAYAYLAGRYGLEQVAIAGLTPDAEPSAQRLAQIADHVRELGLGYILVEPILGTRLAETVRRETGVELLPIHQIESATLAELSEHGDYMGLMENNLRSLSIALECDS